MSTIFARSSLAVDCSKGAGKASLPMENIKASVVVNAFTRSLTALKLAMPQLAVCCVYERDFMSAASCDGLVVSVRFTYPE